MALVRGVMRVGAAAFALGLSLAGPHIVGIAAADTSNTESTSVSSGPARPASDSKRSVPARAAKPARVAAGRTVSRAPSAAARPNAAGIRSHKVSSAAVGATSLRAFGSSVANRLSGHPATPIADFLQGGLLLTRRTFLPSLKTGLVGAQLTGSSLPQDTSAPPTITVHNQSGQTIWIYNLTTSGDYSIPSDFVPVQVENGSTTPVTLAVGTGAVGSPENRIYIVEGPTGFTLPVTSSSGVDAFNPTAPTAGNSFQNYSFVEYYYYPVNGGAAYQYTIDTSYIDEWSLPIQMQFTLNGANWSGAVNGKTYGFKDFDTVVNQLNAAGAPYNDLVWSGSTPWTPQPPTTVSRIIGPDKVWAEQSGQPASNVNMNNAGWVPTSYQNFVQYGATSGPNGQINYPYAQDGTQYSAAGNFNFWKFRVDAPGSTPYPIALRTAAMLDGFPADSNGVYGFFTYPNDETAGQFTNIPSTVSLDIYVNGSSDGVSDRVIDGGKWFYSAPSGSGWRNVRSNPLSGTDATDTFILNHVFRSKRGAPLVKADEGQSDIVAIDTTLLPGAESSVVDIVDKAQFWGRSGSGSQFVYDSTTGYLYYDRHPCLPGYTGVLARLSPSSVDPATEVFVL